MALPTNYIAEIKRILDSISTNLPGYVTRQSQKRMIAAIAEVLSRAPAVVERKEGEERPEPPINDGSTILCVQGPTGVGKSLGYLIGAAVAAKLQGRKLIVSSATVALQEQLVGRDVPFFVKNSGLALTCAIAKGRGRYTCHSKLRRAAGNAAQDDMFGVEEDASEKANAADAKVYAGLLSEYEAGRWSGDRDELPNFLSDKSWSAITTDRHSCINKKCPDYGTCAQMKARNSVRQSDIVVANHDILLADMALGGGVILPAPEDSFYVLDEGHHIAQKAVGAFAQQHHVDAGKLMMQKLSDISAKYGQSFLDQSVLAINISDDAEYLAESLDEAYTMFANLGDKFFADKVWRFPENRLPEAAETLASNIIKTSQSILKRLAEALEFLKKQDSVLSQKFLSDLGFYFGKTESIYETWSMVYEKPVDGSMPIAKWVAIDERKTGREKGSVDFVVNASPVVAADMLVKSFFEQAAGVIVTSATLMTLGNFDQLLRETGLNTLLKTSLLSLPSPFNHAEQGEMSIPDINAGAQDSVAHTAAIAKHMPRLVEYSGNKGTLVLFSSRKQMTEVAEALPAWLRSILLIQGDRSKNALLELHYEQIRSGNPSVIFGLQSFSEGLDLPGDACGHVIIAKLPFAVPNDPVQETLSEWLEAQNKSYFMEIAVPQACLRMIQAAGRLIRTEKDTGRLTILDDRIKKKRYGKMILDSLPPFRMV